MRHRLRVQVRHKATTHGEDAKQMPLKLGGRGLLMAQCCRHEGQGQTGQHQSLARGEVAGRNRRGLRRGVSLPTTVSNNSLLV